MDPAAPRLAWPAAGIARVYLAGRFTQDDRGFSREHSNPHLTIHLFAFAAAMRIDGRQFDVRPGDLTLTPPDAVERFSLTRTGLHWAVRLIPGRGMPGGPLDLALHHRLGHRAVEARRRIELIAQDFRGAAGDATHPSAWAAAAGAQALLCWLAGLERISPSPSRTDSCVDKATALLRAQECAAIPIAEVARRAGMSQNRLAAAFLKRHGLSMVQYRTRHLIETAKWLLESTDLPLSEIRRRIEIQDPHRFNKLFRRMTGLSPSAWLAAHAPAMASSPRPPLRHRQKAVDSGPPGMKPAT